MSHTAPLASAVAEPAVGAYVMDVGGEGGTWILSTSFSANDAVSLFEKRGASEAPSGHRICVLLEVVPFAESPTQFVRGPIRMLMERKWREGGFSLEVDSAVEMAGASPVRTGLDQAVVTAAIGMKCFAEGAPAAPQLTGEGDLPFVASLHVGVSVRFGPGLVQVEQRAPDGTVVTVRREFPSAEEGPTTKISTSK